MQVFMFNFFCINVIVLLLNDYFYNELTFNTADLGGVSISPCL